MSLPLHTLTISSFSLTESSALHASLKEAPYEGVRDVTFSQEHEEYWPDKFATRYSVVIALEDDANILAVRDWIRTHS